ncbi:hypothetical protein B0H14DRAFT_3478194 [Mycena olivaceomarginata]|nr:hypothetical protein B0H14DRAFT_3478194 [Mycena olivaceomarginata]
MVLDPDANMDVDRTLVNSGEEEEEEEDDEDNEDEDMVLSFTPHEIGRAA